MWSPSGHALAYVRGNDLYVVHARDIPKETSKAIRVTDSGTDSIFNAVTDWVRYSNISRFSANVHDRCMRRRYLVHIRLHFGTKHLK